MKQLLALFILCTTMIFAADLPTLKIGEAVPKFSLKNYDGKELSLEKLNKDNNYTVLMFISTECPVSNSYNEKMVSLNDTYTEKGIKFVGINANQKETTDDIAKHSKEHKFKFPVLKDAGNKIADLYGALVTPEVYVVNKEGKLVYHGRIDDAKMKTEAKTHDLQDALDALIAGKEVPQAETTARGCTIKRVVNE